MAKRKTIEEQQRWMEIRDFGSIGICCICIVAMVIGILLIADVIPADKGVQLGLGISLIVCSTICCCATSVYCLGEALKDYKSAWN